MKWIVMLDIEYDKGYAPLPTTPEEVVADIRDSLAEATVLGALRLLKVEVHPQGS